MVLIPPQLAKPGFPLFLEHWRMLMEMNPPQS